MPVFNDIDAVTLDVDGIAHAVVTIGLTGMPAGFSTGFHRHRKAQCVMALSGVLTCEADGGIWMVPPETAVWIPAGLEHCITFAGSVGGYNAFIDPAVAPPLPATCCAIAATPLLRTRPTAPRWRSGPRATQ